MYIVALDQGTTSSRAVVFDRSGAVAASHSIEFEQIYPQPGYVEHDPYAILQSQTDCLRYAVQKAGIGPEEITAIGITNQRETVLVWDRRTGKPLCNALVWQCRRTAQDCRKMIDDGLEPMIAQKTGLIIDAYFSATKLAWVLDNIPGARTGAENGDLCFGTVDSYLLWHLTDGKQHKTDRTNAARTMLYNIHTLNWDDDLLALFRIPRVMLPEVVDSSGTFGLLDKRFLGRQIPILAMAGDQQAALFGQCCHRPGMVKNTYGTGCFVLMNTGDTPVASQNRLLTTIAWSLHGTVTYALEGSVFVAGAAIQWLRDELKIIDNAAETQEIARSIPSSEGVVLVPAFTGLGAPHWDMYARGTLLGMTRGTGRAHIVRAALEAIAYQSHDVISAMQADAVIPLDCLRVDGGASANDFLMQFQADLLGVEVCRPKVVETTALGAAMLAGIAGGFWTQGELDTLHNPERTFKPNGDPATVGQGLKVWKKAVSRALLWEEG